MVGISQKISSSTTLLLRVQLNHNQHCENILSIRVQLTFLLTNMIIIVWEQVVVWHTVIVIVFNKIFVSYKIFDMLF